MGAEWGLPMGQRRDASLRWKVKSGTFERLQVERLFAQDTVKCGAADAERFGRLNLVTAHFFEDFLCV